MKKVSILILFFLVFLSRAFDVKILSPKENEVITGSLPQLKVKMVGRFSPVTVKVFLDNTEMYNDYFDFKFIESPLKIPPNTKEYTLKLIYKSGKKTIVKTRKFYFKPKAKVLSDKFPKAVITGVGVKVYPLYVVSPLVLLTKTFTIRANDDNEFYFPLNMISAEYNGYICGISWDNKLIYEKVNFILIKKENVVEGKKLRKAKIKVSAGDWIAIPTFTNRSFGKSYIKVYPDKDYEKEENVISNRIFERFHLIRFDTPGEKKVEVYLVPTNPFFKNKTPVKKYELKVIVK